MPEASIFDAYQAQWQAHYGVPCSLILSPLDYGKLGTHLRSLSVAQMTAALQGYFKTDDPLVLKRRHPIGLFLVQPSRYLPMPTKPTYQWPCPHTPVCANTRACCGRQDRDRR